MVEINPLEDLICFLLWHVELVESRANLIDSQSARVVLVEGAEGVSQLCKVERAGVNLIDQEGECLDLETLRLSEVFDTF